MHGSDPGWLITAFVLRISRCWINEEWWPASFQLVTIPTILNTCNWKQDKKQIQNKKHSTNSIFTNSTWTFMQYRYHAVWTHCQKGISNAFSRKVWSTVKIASWSSFLWDCSLHVLQDKLTVTSPSWHLQKMFGRRNNGLPCVLRLCVDERRHVCFRCPIIVPSTCLSNRPIPHLSSAKQRPLTSSWGEMSSFDFELDENKGVHQRRGRTVIHALGQGVRGSTVMTMMTITTTRTTTAGWLRLAAPLSTARPKKTKRYGDHWSTEHCSFVGKACTFLETPRELWTLADILGQYLFCVPVVSRELFLRPVQQCLSLPSPLLPLWFFL